MTKKQFRRMASLLPGGVPRYLRCYDNGGETIDRYTVIFGGRTSVLRLKGCANQYPYLAMNCAPFHPQGFGQHGHTNHQPADTIRAGGGYNWPPAIGRKCHLGTRIRFTELPEDCQKLALRDYLEIWSLEAEPLKAAA